MSQLKNNLKNKITAIILCAGEGRRLGKITKKIPKPLIQIKSLNNISILQHSLNSLIRLGFTQIAIVKGHLGAKIDQFISSLKKNSENLRDKLIVIDPGTQYKLGPLHSFLSITNIENIFKEKFIYMVIPGDTIFQFSLLSQIYSIVSKNFTLIQKFPLTFYKELKVRALKKQHGSKIVSIVDIKEKNHLRRIKRRNLMEYLDSDFIRQIIPVFIFSYDFIKDIIDFEKRISANTIREIINNMIKKGRDVFTVKIGKDYDFYDIDYEIDLIKFGNIAKEKKKGDNRSSDRF